MILSIKITIEELSKIGKEHKWPKNFCEGCNRNMWGHGYVSRYFATVVRSVYLKRYRCPGCGVVVVVRPEGYWSKIRNPIVTIYQTLRSKLNFGKWPEFTSRQRGGHWLNRFVSFARMELQSNLTEFLDYCYLKQIRFLP